MKKVFVAMSGGVDSSVAAALLKERGYAVTGVFMKFWTPHLGGITPGVEEPVHPGGGGAEREGYCLWKKERQDALRVASILDIPLLTWDFTKEYEKKVVEYMLQGYKNGITPNPDLMCNKEIKFGLFFDRALKEGANLIATGHYARIKHTNPKSKILNPKQIQNRKSEFQNILNLDHSNFDIISDLDISASDLYHLLRAKDDNKDQSYFLYTLTQKHLEKTLFPIGEYTKPEVRELAKKFGLPVAQKKDSQGVCFIGPIKVSKFLKENIVPKKGEIYMNNELIGEHDGVYYYTIGQRHGMDIKTGGGPYFVTGKDIKNNILYVGDESDLYLDRALVSDLEWVGEAPKMPVKLMVKIRYRGQDAPVLLGTVPAGDSPLSGSLIVQFDKPVRAVTPGQAAVFYEGDRVVGGGTII